jgi:hypothetical protein
MTARVLAGLIEIYAIAGAAFGAAFVIAGAARIDASAKDAGAGFRLMIAPGSAALWPLLLRRWIAAARGGKP